MRQFAKCQCRVMNGLPESSQLLVHCVIDRFAGNLGYLRIENLKYVSIFFIYQYMILEKISLFFFQFFLSLPAPFLCFPKISNGILR